MTLATIDWGPVSGWAAAVVPLLVGGVVTRALNRTTQTIKEAVRVTRPGTLRERFRAATRPDRRHDSDHHTGASQD